MGKNKNKRTEPNGTPSKEESKYNASATFGEGKWQSLMSSGPWANGKWDE